MGHPVYICKPPGVKKKKNRRVRGYRGEMSLSLIQFLIQLFGPQGLSQLLNYDIIDFPEEGYPKSSKQIEFPSLKSGRGQMVSTPEQETLQLRALKLLTPITGTFPLSSFTLREKCFGLLSCHLISNVLNS